MAGTGQESVGCLDLSCRANSACSTKPPCPQGESQADTVGLGKTGDKTALVLAMALGSGTGRRKRTMSGIFSASYGLVTSSSSSLL